MHVMSEGDASRRSPLLRDRAPSDFPALARSFSSRATASAKRVKEVLVGRYLHSGFGTLHPESSAGRKPSYRWMTGSLAVAVLMACITVHLLYRLGTGEYGIPRYFNETRLASDFQAYVNPDEKQQAGALANLAMLPLIFGIFNYLIANIRRTTFWWDEAFVPASAVEEITGSGAHPRSDSDEMEPKKTMRFSFGIDAYAFVPFLTVALWTLRSFSLAFFKEPLNNHAAIVFKFITVMVVLCGYYELLDMVEFRLHCLKQGQYKTMRELEHIRKSQKLVSNLTQTGMARDETNAFKHANTAPAEILQYAWWPYYMAGKLLGVGVALSVFMDFTINPMLALSATTALVFVLDLGPNMVNLVRLSLFTPFYPGDLVTLNSTGAADTPQTSIMGFVENITVNYVVIRNFEMKQTWIAHKQFSELVIQNWSRRPTKTVLLNFGISCKCSKDKVERLASFGKQWIKNSPDIMNGKGARREGYQKCHVTGTSNGYNIQVIFYPDIGVSHRDIRQKFIAAFMAYAESLKIPFVPLQLQQNFCEADEAEMHVDEQDLQAFMPTGPPLPRKED